MLTAAALVPDTAALVPGVTGTADLLAAQRSAALAGVRAVCAAQPDRVVVVTASDDDASVPTSGADPGPWLPTFGAAGIPSTLLGWAFEPTAGAGPVRVLDQVAAAVGVLLLTQAGWKRPVSVVLAGGSDADALQGLGAELVAGGRVGLVLVGSLSARRGSEAPLPQDARAARVDDEVLADLLDLDDPALARLSAVPHGLATELAVSAWTPWQVLVGAVRAGGPAAAPYRTTLHDAGAPFGADYAIVSWVAA